MGVWPEILEPCPGHKRARMLDISSCKAIWMVEQQICRTLLQSFLNTLPVWLSRTTTSCSFVTLHYLLWLSTRSIAKFLLTQLLVFEIRAMPFPTEATCIYSVLHTIFFCFDFDFSRLMDPSPVRRKRRRITHFTVLMNAEMRTRNRHKDSQEKFVRLLQWKLQTFCRGNVGNFRKLTKEYVALTQSYFFRKSNLLRS